MQPPIRNRRALFCMTDFTQEFNTMAYKGHAANKKETTQTKKETTQTKKKTTQAKKKTSKEKSKTQRKKKLRKQN